MPSINARLPDDLYLRARAHADREERSLGAVVRRALARHCQASQDQGRGEQQGHSTDEQRATIADTPSIANDRRGTITGTPATEE